MARGGKRPGAGRKPGARQKVSREARARAAKTGELPHEFLLRVSRGGEIDGHQVTFEERRDAARDAAPYFAPKLASTQVTGKDGGSIQFTAITRTIVDSRHTDS